MPDMNGPVDEALLRRQRFEALAEAVYEPLQRYLRRRIGRDEADDAFNDVLLTLWRRLDDIPPDAALPWSYGVARRILANTRRSSRRRLQLLDRVTADERMRVDGGDDQPEYPEVAAAVAALNEDDRELIRLWAWEELEPREIAIVLGTTPNAVSLRLTRVKKRLAAHLQRQDAAAAGHEAIGNTEETS